MEILRHLFSCDMSGWSWSSHEFVAPGDESKSKKKSSDWTNPVERNCRNGGSEGQHRLWSSRQRKKQRLKGTAEGGSHGNSVNVPGSNSSSLNLLQPGGESSIWGCNGCGGTTPTHAGSGGSSGWRERKRYLKNGWSQRKWPGGEWTSKENNNGGDVGGWGRRERNDWRDGGIEGTVDGWDSDEGQSGEEKGLSRRVLYMVVILISIGAYWNSLSGDFVHDDLSAIKTNGDVTGQNSIWKIFLNDFWGKPMADRTSHKSYRPFTILTFRLNRLLHGLEPTGYHVFNLVLHSLVCVVFVKICLEVARTSKRCALLAGAHFASHPIHTEAVTGVVGRADLLAALFLLLSFHLYSRYQKEVEKTGLILGSIVLAFGGMLSKEHGITVLGINFTWDVYLHRYLIKNYIFTRKWNAKLHHLLIRLFIVGLGTIGFLTFRIVMLQGSLPEFSDQDNPASFAPCKLTRLRTFTYLPVFNFWLLLAPISLNYDWQMGSIPLVEKWTDIRNIPCILFYTTLLWVIGYVVYKVKKTRREVVLALSFLIIPFIPASNLLFRVGFVVAERVLYIPSLGFSLLVGAGVERIIRRQKYGVKSLLWQVFLLLLLSLFLTKTWLRNQDWKSRESLFTSGLRLLPHNAKMHYNYANLQKDLGNTEQAILHYRFALELWPHHASAHNNLGTLLNDTAEAEEHFQKALRINPVHARAYFNLSLLRYQQGKTNVALRLMERSLELEPDNTDALTNLATMHSDLGNLEKAREIYLKILQLEPDNAEHLNNYGTFLQRMGESNEALAMYEEALQKDGNHTGALLNTARIMKKLKFTEKAESLYQRALERNPDDALVKVSLAQTYVYQRKYNEAESLLLTVMEQSNSSRREVFHQLATLYSQHLNRTSDAFRFIEMAVKTCSDHDISCAPLHALNGDLYKDVDDFDSAILSYQEAVKTLIKVNTSACCFQQKHAISSSIVTHVHLNLGAIYHVKGQFQDAWVHYNAALVHDPTNKVLLQNMEKLKKAELQKKMTACRTGQNRTKCTA